MEKFISADLIKEKLSQVFPGESEETEWIYDQLCEYIDQNAVSFSNDKKRCESCSYFESRGEEKGICTVGFRCHSANSMNCVRTAEDFCSFYEKDPDE